MKILLIDDDLSIHALIKKSVNSLVSLVSQTELPVSETLHEFDLIILDLFLEQTNSLEFLKVLKQTEPYILGKIILLTGSGNEEDEVEAHRLGLRDFVKKPFSPKVLGALIDKHLTQMRSTVGIKYGPFLLNLAETSITLVESKSKLDLTKTEFDVMRMLIEARGKVVNREKLMTEVWHMHDDTLTRTVDMHMSTIRKKIHPYGDLLKTKRGVGYYLS